jgi:hypothetical protein
LAESFNEILKQLFFTPGEPDYLFAYMPGNLIGSPESQKQIFLDEFDQLTSRCEGYLSLCNTLSERKEFEALPVQYVILESMEFVETVCNMFEYLVKDYSGRSIVNACALGLFIAEANKITNAASNTRDRLLHDAKLLNAFLEGEPPEKQENHSIADNSEWSKPKSKTAMRLALGMTEGTFNSYADRIGIKKVNRSLHQLRIDQLDTRTREKIEKA